MYNILWMSTTASWRLIPCHVFSWVRSSGSQETIQLAALPSHVIADWTEGLEWLQNFESLQQWFPTRVCVCEMDTFGLWHNALSENYNIRKLPKTSTQKHLPEHYCLLHSLSFKTDFVQMLNSHYHKLITQIIFQRSESLSNKVVKPSRPLSHWHSLPWGWQPLLGLTPTLLAM